MIGMQSTLKTFWNQNRATFVLCERGGFKVVYLFFKYLIHNFKIITYLIGVDIELTANGVLKRNL